MGSARLILSWHTLKTLLQILSAQSKCSLLDNLLLRCGGSARLILSKFSLWALNFFLIQLVFLEFLMSASIASKNFRVINFFVLELHLWWSVQPRQWLFSQQPGGHLSTNINIIKKLLESSINYKFFIPIND